MKLTEYFLTNNPCYKQGKHLNVKGLMLHSVGCPQARAKVFADAWNKPDYNRACVHGFIDANTATILQTLPWDMQGWHAGGSANTTHIGVEMCEPDCIVYGSGANFTTDDLPRARMQARTTYEAAVELFAYLCKMFNLDPLADGVIISHAEGCKRGIASNHADPDHLWFQLGLPYTMDTFRHNVWEKLQPVEEPSDWAKEACEKAIAKGVIAGYGNGKYGWKDPITREQMLVILDRLGVL